MAKHGAFQYSTADLYLIPPEEIVLVKDPAHPLYDQRVNLPLDEALVRSIMAQGVLEPILIVKAENKAFCLAGRQRVRCAQEANRRLAERGSALVKVPCRLQRGEDSKLFGMLISENENRQDDTPLGRAAKAQRLLELGASREEAAVYFGVTTAALAKWLKLLELPTAVRKAVAKGQLFAEAALQFHGMADVEADVKLAEVLAASPTAQPVAGRPRGGRRPSAGAVATALGKNGSRMRSKKEVATRLATPKLAPDYKAALQWVLCITE